MVFEKSRVLMEVGGKKRAEYGPAVDEIYGFVNHICYRLD